MAERTPQVNFSFTNNNVQASTPSLGISHVIARTTKGPFNQPDTVFSSFQAFKRVYGEEVVPDGSISNIQKAFENGSRLRISRVAGAGEVAKGTSKTYTITPATETDPAKGTIGSAAGLTFTFYNPTDTTKTITGTVGFSTKEYGSAIVDPADPGKNKNFFLVVSSPTAPTKQLYLTQTKAINLADESINAEEVLDSRLMYSGANIDTTTFTGTPFIDVQVFQEFISGVPNLELTPTNFVEGETPVTTITNADTLVSFMRSHADWWLNITAGTGMFAINEGTNGGDSDADTWMEAYDAIKGNQDGYKLILSHVHQHLTDWQGVIKDVALDVSQNYEIMLLVEVPKYKADGTIPTPEDLITTMETLVPATGPGKLMAYFGGGLKYYDNYGAKKDCDVLGTILGLSDTSATNNGPWKSFAGQNRGIVPNALGPVIRNLGSSADIDTLNAFAKWYLNVFVVKDTRTTGRQTMLQSAFTANPRNDSEKFISIVMLNLYLKKNLRPILEAYLEEPNTFETWRRIYQEVKPILDDLRDNQQAMSEYTWMGDQDKTSYADLEVNNEADVRQGKYKIILKYKDIVPIQEISIEIVIDAVNANIEIIPA